MLPHRSLLEGSRDPAALEPLITAAEEALRTWEPVWTGFLAPELREEAEARLGGLSELSVASLGGLVGAERRRLLRGGSCCCEVALKPRHLAGDAGLNLGWLATPTAETEKAAMPN